MISNLLAAIRDDKGVQLGHGASTEGNKESKAGFGLIFQTLQEEGSKEQGKNQPSSGGQTELTGEDVSAGETDTGNVKTESGKKQMVVRPDANPASKTLIKKAETAQTAQVEATQTEQGQKEIVDQKSTLQIAKADGNTGKTHITIQANLDISSTDGISNHEMQEAIDTDGKAKREVKSANNKEKPVNELTTNQEAASDQVNTAREAVLSGQSNLTESNPATNIGQNTKPQKVAETPDTEEVQKPAAEEKNVENSKNLADVKQEITVSSSQRNSETEAATGSQKTVSESPNGRADILQAETQNEEEVVFKEGKLTQLNDKTQTQISAEARVTSSAELAPPDNHTATSDAGQVVKADGLTKPVLDAAENDVQNIKVETPSKESISIRDADKSKAETQTRPEISMNQEEKRIVGTLKTDEIKDLVFKISERQKLQNATQASETRDSVSEENQEKLIHNTLINKETTYPLENGTVLKKLLTDDIREKKYRDRQYNFEGRAENATAREKILIDGRNSQQWSGQMGSFSNSQFQMSETMSSPELKMNEDELSWKKHSVDGTQLKENKVSEQQSIGFARLMEIPLFNASVRRNLLPALTQTVLKTGSGNGTSTENWQKHNFTLENGKNLQLSMRQVDGVVYMKLNSTHSELTRLLVQHQDEIRQHLQKECNLEIDLQFEDSEDQDLSQFFDDSSSGKREWRGKSTMTGGKTFMERESQDVQTTIRKFGYNRMEWMA